MLRLYSTSTLSYQDDRENGIKHKSEIITVYDRSEKQSNTSANVSAKVVYSMQMWLILNN